MLSPCELTRLDGITLFGAGTSRLVPSWKARLVAKMARGFGALSASTRRFAPSRGISQKLMLYSYARLQTSDKVLLSLCQLASRNLLCTGSTDRQVALWDLGASESNIALTLSGHGGPVSSVCAHPTNPTMLASGSYDGTVRVWDARSEKQALFVLPMPPREDDQSGQGEKVLAVDWDGDRLVAGGEGKRVVVWNVSAGGKTASE